MIKPLTNLITGSLIVLITMSCSAPEEPDAPKDQPVSIRAVDASFYPEMVDAGITYSDSSGVASLPVLLKRHGFNMVRLRVWNQPATTRSSPNEVLEAAATFYKAGLGIWIDFHYSDTWADPGHQTPPAAWSGLSAEVLADSVYAFTRRFLEQLRDRGVVPGVIQTGNEISGGMLWPAGLVNSVDTTQWRSLSRLLNAGLQACNTVFPTARRMIHIADPGSGFWFFGYLNHYLTDYDLVGVSWYPWWHGKDLSWLTIQLTQLNRITGKPVIIAETAYPWTLGWNDWTNNIVGNSSQCVPGFPPDPAGQQALMRRIASLARSVNQEPVHGWCYWAPEHLAAYGPQSTHGSPWENLTLFDFTGKALPAFYEVGRPTSVD